jgi:predicted phage terminase large subunit-like protein
MKLTPAGRELQRAMANARHCQAVAAARRNPNAFIQHCCTDPDGRPLVQSAVHWQLQKFLSDSPRALVELPRDHGKTVQVCARVLWELGRNAALRVKIVCATEGIAEERGRFLRLAIAGNPLVREVFPRLEPGEPWAETRFTIRRPADVIGPSVTTLGVCAGLTGTRADLLVCDDIVDVKSLTSAAERARVKAFFRDNLMNLLEPDGRCWCLFTPWHANDLNAELKKSGAFRLFRRSVGLDLRPVWPERWPRRRLDERRREIGAASFARGYRLLPLTPEVMKIRPEWVRYWCDDVRLGSPDLRVVLAIDPAVSTKPTADASALVVLAREADNAVRCLEAVARRLGMPDLVHLIDELDRRWEPEAILFESNAAFRGIKDLLVRHARFGPKIRAVEQTRSKMARVDAFSVSVENGSFLLKGSGGAVDPGQQALYDEMTTFPAGEHDDLLDAAAMATEYLLGKREPRAW